MSVAFFDATGRVMVIADGSDARPPSAPAGALFMADDLPEGAQANDIYYDIDAGALAYRQPFALTIERNRISGIPTGTLAMMPDGSEVVEDGEIEFVADIEEGILVALDHPHHVYEVVSVETGP